VSFLIDSYHKLPTPIRRRIRKIISSKNGVIAPAQKYFYPRLAKAQSLLVTRESRDECWCGGSLMPFEWHESYGVCAICGTYVNKIPPAQKGLEKFYSLGNYWHTRQALKNFPTIGDRAGLYRSDGRLQQWLDLVEKYGPKTGKVIEIGCAPGVLLGELTARGYSCTGVEISNDVAEWMRNSTGLEIHSGFFPGVELPRCDLFLAFDVLEHSPCPLEFLKSAADHLLPNGVAIIQTAIDRYDYQPPFGERFDMFDDLEHLFLFTNQAMTSLAKEANLEIVSLGERLWLGGETCIFRKAAVN
jgi:SAM-dependent methyltransferase